MSYFAAVDLAHASRLLNHGPTILVTSASGAQRNVMSAAWSTPVEFTPPRIAVVIDKSTYTRSLMLESNAFGICVPGAAFIDQVYAVGSCSGKTIDKFAEYGVVSSPGPVLGLPTIEEGCVAWLECKLIRQPETETLFDTFFGEVVAAAADSRVFANGHWNFNAANADLHTLHHLGAGNFTTASNIIAAKPLK